MSAPISTAPSLAGLPARATHAGKEDSGTALIPVAGEEVPGQFTALIRQLLAGQPSQDVAGVLTADLAANADTPAVDTALDALLPFLDALGLAQGAVTPLQAGADGVEGAAGTLKDSAAALTLAGLAAGLAKQAASNPAITAANAGEQGNGKGPAFGLANALAHAVNSAGADKPNPRDMAGLGEVVSQLAKSRNAAGEAPHLTAPGSAAPMPAAPGAPHAIAQQPASVAGAGPLPALPVTQAVGAAGWQQEVGNRIVWMAQRQDSRAELVLTPPQMGRVEVSLTISGDQANAVFVSANPAVREALEAALPRLREQLAEAGIQLGQAQVGAENARQSAQEGKNGDNFAFSPENDRDAGTRFGSAAASAPLAGLKMGRGIVDVFA